MYRLREGSDASQWAQGPLTRLSLANRKQTSRHRTAQVVDTDRHLEWRHPGFSLRGLGECGYPSSRLHRVKKDAGCLRD